MIRNLILFTLLLLLLQSEQLVMLLSVLSSDMIVLMLNSFGINIVFSEDTFVLDNIAIPWTIDCSGINSFVILLGVVLWKKIQPNQHLKNIILLLLVIAAALMVNVLRALVIIGYRYYFYPEIESQELHFLIGFLLLVPFIYLFIANRNSLSINDWTLIIYFSVVFSLLAPLYYAPGGMIILLATLSCLYLNFNVRQLLNSQWPYYLIWFLAGLLIASSKMESLWLPWLLLWPSILSKQLLTSPTNLVVLTGTIQPLAMNELWQGVVIVMIGYQMIKAYTMKENIKPKSPISNKLTTTLLSCYALFFPIITPSFGTEVQDNDRLPRGTMNSAINHNAFKLRLIGQPNKLDIYLFQSNDNDRHHTLVSCMRFKGVLLEENKDIKGVYESDQRFMREFFVVDGKVINNYRDYIVATLLPFKNAGKHVIFDAPKEMFNADYFNQQANKYMSSLIRQN